MADRQLILVPCHGVCRAGSWIGIYPGEGELLAAHIEAGIRLACRQADALLVFSGGQTRAEAGPRSEASGYLELAGARGWFGCPEVAPRTALEEYARDSLENLASSLALFRRIRGRDPERIVVAGWKFKQPRFGLHRAAICWPGERFEYVGVNDPEGEALTAALYGELRTIGAVALDPRMRGPEFERKRRERDPFGRGNPYV